jgi:hypothetical protein
VRDFREVEKWKKMVRTSRNSQGMDELESLGEQTQRIFARSRNLRAQRGHLQLF